MSTTPAAAVIDALNSLLEAEHHAACRFMGEGSPYLARASADVRESLRRMAESNDRHRAHLGQLIHRLGGRPAPAAPGTEEQYLRFLSLKFLLPKLADDKELTIQRYDNALRALEDAPPEVTELLSEQQADHRAQLDILRQAAAEVIAASR